MVKMKKAGYQMALFKGQHSEKCEKGRVCKITNNSYEKIIKKFPSCKKEQWPTHSCIELHVLCYMILQRSWCNNN